MPLSLCIKKYPRQILSKRRDGDRASAAPGRSEKIINNWINVSPSDSIESAFDSRVSKSPNENMPATAQIIMRSDQALPHFLEQEMKQSII